MNTVLFSAPYMIPALERFRPIFETYNIDLIVPEIEERLSEQELMPIAGQFDGAICGDDRFSRKVLEACAPRLKVISKWGTGIDSIDLDAAAEFGVRVANTPGAFTDPVSDTVMGYILAFARRQPWMDQAMKEAVWGKIPGRSLNECTLGVVGVGRIGKAVIERARGFGMRLLGNDIVEIDRSFVDKFHVEMTSLKELLGQADFVSLNCDLNPTSKHLIKAETLAWMKPTAILVNTARGSVVCEPDLVEALAKGVIAGAALDVFEEEPLSKDSPLLDMGNVMLAPHNANSSPKAWERVHWNTIRNLLEGLELSSEVLDQLEGEHSLEFNE